ncbi:hypothetical protein L208DRAFT_1234845 [Tricholoma matsutake]|nr:hypothetical protein L208DRAFT_1234845 [Tricholoma matsutake 945]
MDQTIPGPVPEAGAVTKKPTHVLDDAFHFMDHLLRLLPKCHSAFDSFSHDFSEAIFIHDKDDKA